MDKHTVVCLDNEIVLSELYPYNEIMLTQQ